MVPGLPRTVQARQCCYRRRLFRQRIKLERSLQQVCLTDTQRIEPLGIDVVDLTRAEYICQIDWDACNGCKSCMSQCQFGAQFYSSAMEKVDSPTGPLLLIWMV